MSEKESIKQSTRNKGTTSTSANDKHTPTPATLNGLIQQGGFAVWDHSEEYPSMQTNTGYYGSKESPLNLGVNKQKQTGNQSYSEAFKMTVGERVQMLVNDTNIRNKIYELASSGQLRISAPILRLDILTDPTKDLELDKDDLADVFSRYGEVVDVIIKPPTKAYIVFKDIVSAVFAKKCLNGYNLNELDVNLRISYLDLPEAPAIPTKHYHELIEYYEMITARGGEASAGMRMYYPNTAELSDMTPNSAASQQWMNKLTCRYEIQIENDKEFQVARKIIGSKGCNMKRIVDLCNKQFKAERTNNGEIVKLRLRGRGSGFKEGPEKLESQDPLHLCISAKSKEIYDMACHLVEELLNNIYEEYKKFYQSRGRAVKLAPVMKKIETFPWNKSSNVEGYYGSEQTVMTPTQHQQVVMGYAPSPGSIGTNSNQNVIGSGKRNY